MSSKWTAPRITITDGYQLKKEEIVDFANAMNISSQMNHTLMGSKDALHFERKSIAFASMTQ